MSLSYNQHIDLSTNTFSFTFSFINIDDVFALGLRTSDDKWIPLTITGRSASAKTVTVSDSLTPYSKVQVYRKTTVAPIVDFQDGSRLTERDLDTAYRQGLYVAQEVAENSNQSTQREDVDTDIIANGAITTTKIANHAVTAQKISLTLDLSTHAVTLATGEISTSELANDAVDSTKLANDAVNSEHLVDGSVDNVHLAGGIDLTTKVTGTLPAANGGTGVNTAIPFTKGFSGSIPLPDDDITSSLDHGLSGVPKLITGHLKCKSATNGHAVGDIVNLGASDDIHVYNIFADATKIYFRRDASLAIINRTTGGHFDVLAANFDVVLSAYE